MDAGEALPARAGPGGDRHDDSVAIDGQRRKELVEALRIAPAPRRGHGGTTNDSTFERIACVGE